MAMISDNAMDAASDYIADACTYLHLCTGEPEEYADVAGVSVGTVAIDDTDWTNADGATSGRKTTLAAQTITPSGSGTVTHLAVVSGSELLAVFDLAASIAVSAGVAVTTAAAVITHPDYTVAS